MPNYAQNNPLRSVADYEDQYARADANALALQQGRAKMDEYQRGLQEQQQVRNLLSQTKTPEEAINVLSTAGFLKEADDIAKRMVSIRAQESTSAKNAADTKAQEIKNRHDLLAFGIQGLQTAATAEQARQKINEGVTKGYWSMQEAQQYAGEVPDDPAKFGDWRQTELRKIIAAKDQLPKVQTVNMGGTENVIATDIFGKPTTTGTFAKTQTPDSVASNETQRRWQNMIDDRARATTDAGKWQYDATRGGLVNMQTGEFKPATQDGKPIGPKPDDEKKARAVKAYSDTLEKNAIPEFESALGELEGQLAKYPIGEAPGLGRGAGLVPDWLQGAEGENLRQSMAAVQNIILKARSGAAVTESELRRLVNELGTGGFRSDGTLRKGVERIRARFESAKANAAAGVSDDVKQQYEEGGGVKIKRGGDKPPADSAAYADAEKERRYQEWKARQKKP